MKITIKAISKENESVLALPNDPFQNEGRVIPVFDGSNWDYRIEEFEEDKITEDCFPPENYRLEEMEKGFHGIAAYVDGKEAGYALFFEQWNQYLYLDNLLVRGKYRRCGVGTALLEAGTKLAGELGKLGVWLVCQDNNLAAIKCYFQNGFELGGMNLPVYDGTSQAGKADLYLYKKLPSYQEGKIRMAFFDVDGVLSVPCYLRDGQIKNGFGSLQDWIDYCEEMDADAYKDCMPVPIVKRHAQQLKQNGAVLYALTTSFSDAETRAKKHFVERCYPGLFREVIAVSEDSRKVPTMLKLSETERVRPQQCELVEDTLTTIFAAEDCGIFAMHVSRLFAEE